ncbi:MAG: SDR family oxidoreductase [Polyangiaceae bacterium]
MAASESTAGVIVFGGSGALGAAICRALTSDGARVGFTYFRGEAKAHELARQLPGSACRQLDLTQVGDIARVLGELRAELGEVRGFVHAATLTSAAKQPHFEAIADAEAEAFDRLFAVNVRSAFFACRELSRDFSGNIVLLGSLDGAKSVPSPVAYAASKGALGALARALSKELGPRGVRVNVVAPGVLESGSSTSVPSELRAEYLKHCGLKRFGRLEEIAGLVSYLTLFNSYVTGQTLVADGAL